MRTYCTLFDKNYLYQAVTLHDSLRRFSGAFKLYALCMDPVAHRTIAKMNDNSLVPVNIEDLLTPQLSALRNRTTHGQFCWASQPFICGFLLDTLECDMVTYLEADSLFLSSPEILFRELGEAAISLVPHNFSPEYNQVSYAGTFCVQFNAFRRGPEARAVLEYWKRSCLEYTKEKPDFYPGQLCLDNWPKLFDGVKILEHRGAGVAPWNVQRVRIEAVDSVLHIDGVPIVFYHFHQYGRFENGSHELGYYSLSARVIDSLYRPYVEAIRTAERRVQTIDPEFNYQRTYPNNKSFSEVLKSGRRRDFDEYIRVLKRKLRGKHNVFPDEYFGRDPKEAGNA